MSVLIAALRRVTANDDLLKLVQDHGTNHRSDFSQLDKYKHGLLWYIDFHNTDLYSDAKINDKIIEDLKPFRMSTNETLYRGLFWPEEEGLDEFLKGAEVGDEVIYDCSQDFESWTADFSFAENWIEDTGIGAVIEYPFKPSDTILDTDMIPPELKSTMKYADQEQEVLVRSCPRKVKITKIRRGD